MGSKASSHPAQIRNTEILNKLKQAEEIQSENTKLTSQNLRGSKTEVWNRPNKIDAEQESKVTHQALKKDSKVQNSPLMRTYQYALFQV